MCYLLSLQLTIQSLPTVFSYTQPRLCVPFSEDASLITSLQDELKNLKEEMVQLRSTPVSVPSTCWLVTSPADLHYNSFSDSFSRPLCFSSQMAPQSSDYYRTGKWAVDEGSSHVSQLLWVCVLSFFWFLWHSLTEKDALVTSLQGELREVGQKKTYDEVRLSLHITGFTFKSTLLSNSLLMMSYLVSAEPSGRTDSF